MLSVYSGADAINRIRSFKLILQHTVDPIQIGLRRHFPNALPIDRNYPLTPPIKHSCLERYSMSNEPERGIASTAHMLRPIDYR